ncbi:MAG: antitoxin Xre/MbcA/ParS toxin-binding domain-containing protein [Thermoanaerobaculales bacterium]
MSTSTGIIEALGGSKVLGGGISDMETLLERVREGIPYSSYEHMAGMLAINLQEMGSVLGLPKSTRVRRKGGRLQPVESDRLVRLAKVLAEAETVFGSWKPAAAWMRRENRALGGRSPLSLLDTGIGQGLVEDLLGRLEHGVIG